MRAFPPNKGSIAAAAITLTITKEGKIKNIAFDNKRLKNEKVKVFIRAIISEMKGQWLAGTVKNNKVESKLKTTFAVGLRHLK